MSKSITSIDIEVCEDCKKHSWCTHHNEAQYASLFEETKAAIEKENPGITVTRNCDGKPRIGAFEISGEGIAIFSKMATKIWQQIYLLKSKFTRYLFFYLRPLPNLVAQRVKNFISDFNAGKDCSRYVNIPEKKCTPKRKMMQTQTDSLYGTNYQLAGSNYKQESQQQQQQQNQKVVTEEKTEQLEKAEKVEKVEKQQNQTHEEEQKQQKSQKEIQQEANPQQQQEKKVQEQPQQSQNSIESPTQVNQNTTEQKQPQQQQGQVESQVKEEKKDATQDDTNQNQENAKAQEQNIEQQKQ